MDNVSYFSENGVNVSPQPQRQPVKKASSTGSGALGYLVWSVEIFAAAVAILIGILVCSFCRYEEPEEEDILAQGLGYGEFEFAEYEQYPADIFGETIT